MTEQKFLDRLFYLLLAATVATLYTAYWLYLKASNNPLMPSYLQYEHAQTIMAAIAAIAMFLVGAALMFVAYYSHTRREPAVPAPATEEEAQS